MSKMTLLEVVQSVLSSMDSDNVDTLLETEESEQVAMVAKEVYYDLINRHNWSFLKGLIQVAGLGDTDQPTKMQLLSPVREITSVRYMITDVNADDMAYREICYLCPEDFLDRIYSRNADADNVIKVENDNTDGDLDVRLFIINDKQPEYYTTFNGEHLIFDSYDASIDDTLHETKTAVLGTRIPAWQETETFIPDLPEELFPAYLSDVKSAAHSYFLKESSPRDDRIVFRTIARQRRKEVTVRDAQVPKKPNYGRC